MKYLRVLILFSLIIGTQPAFADDHSMIPSAIENYIGYGAIITVLVLFVIVMLVLLRTFRILTRLVLKAEGLTNAQIEA